MVSYHRNNDGIEIKFELNDESDGTKRLISLIPAFLELAAPRSNKVFIIDEFDRSLHTLLLRQLLESYLDSCSPDTRSQLLFTTHDVLLMDQKLFRRDEMWITERARDGATSLLSFSDFKDVRYDKDIRKSYLEGRLGGVPRILLSGSLAAAAGVRRMIGKTGDEPQKTTIQAAPRSEAIQNHVCHCRGRRKDRT